MGGSEEGSPVHDDGEERKNEDDKSEDSCDEQLPRSIGDYTLSSELLGRGSFSRVFSGTKQSTREPVAIKVLRFCVERCPAQYLREAKINALSQGSPHIVKFYEHFSLNGYGFLIYSPCPLGEVFHQIVPRTGLVQRELIGLYYAQLIEALSYLHERGICHLDVKPENMLIDRPGHMRLADFGLSALAEDGPVHGCHGSLSYAAPENLRSRHSLGCHGYDGTRADMWSSGVVLFVMMFGYAPWDCAADTCATFRAFRASESLPPFRPWNRLPTAIRNIFQRTLSISPNRRWPADVLSQYVVRDCGWQTEPRHISSSLFPSTTTTLPLSSQQQPPIIPSSAPPLSATILAPIPTAISTTIPPPTTISSTADAAVVVAAKVTSTTTSTSTTTTTPQSPPSPPYPPSPPTTLSQQQQQQE